MKLDFIRITSFKNLRNFSFDFDEINSGLVTVLLGQNGSGKSNLLEALVIIFRDLYLGKETEFGYEIRYTIDNASSKISIKNSPAEIRERFNCTVTKNQHTITVSRSQIATSDGQKLLPKHVFAYYSGTSDRLEEHFRDHQQRFYRDLLAGESKPLRPLFYARPVHSQFVLLSFFTNGDSKSLKFLDENFGIMGLESVLFVMKQPVWAKSKRDDSSDTRFWGARGVVASFLDRLYKNSLAPLRVKGKTEAKGISKPKSTEYLYLYVPNIEKLSQLVPRNTAPADFFKELESTYISELIQEVRIRVKIRNLDGSLTFRELSEGEQQLLTVVGLLRFTKDSEALFLLDEPDTHLNPIWGMKYIETLTQIAEPGIDSQVLMATHDPLVLAGLRRQEVVVMERNNSTGRVEAFRPDVDPRGLGVVGILRSSMFGLRTTLDFPTQKKLDRRFNLVAKGDKRSSAENEELQELSKELAESGFANEARDTNYDLFIKAMAKVMQSEKALLTKKEIGELEDQAVEVVKQLLKKGK